MTKRILIIQGHPDAKGGHLCHALADAYADGAEAAGHKVARVEIGALDFPVLRAEADFMTGDGPPALEGVRAQLRTAEHVVIVFPLWLGTMPALLKAFLEQVMRPGFAYAYQENGLPKMLLGGRTGRIIVTMGMPALAFRLWYQSAGVAALKRNILQFVGISPVGVTLFGGVAEADAERRSGWLARVKRLGGEAR